MSASAATISVGTWSPRTSSAKSKSLAIISPILSSSWGKSPGARRDPLIQLVHRGVGQELGGGRVRPGLLGAHLRIDRVGADVGRGGHEPAHLGRYLAAAWSATQPPRE